jgi:chitinase
MVIHPGQDTKFNSSRNSTWRPGILYLHFMTPECHPNSNYYDRDHWAKTSSPNKDVKVYLGAPASQGAAGNGYVSSQNLINVVRASQQKYSSFGGVMLWDADSAYSKPSSYLRVLTRKFPGIFSEWPISCPREKWYQQ